MGDDVRPDDLKRAPSGRVPQWVLDEARGIKNEPTPWRAAPSTTLNAPKKRKRRNGVTFLLIVVAVAVALYAEARSRPPQAPAAAPQPESSPAPRDYPPPGNEEAGSRLLAAPTATGTTGFRFLRHHKDRVTPVTWSPCRPIHYVVRPAHSPVGGDQLLADAFAHLSQATGLQFVNDGSTSEAPSEDRPLYQPTVYGDRWAPVLITWATPDEVPDFGIDIAGEAGPRPAYTADRELTYVSGEVAFDAPYFARLVTTGPGRAFARTVVLHELGHLMGLAHVNDPKQVMAPRGGRNLTVFQPGDLAGLAALGKGPCQPTV